MDRFGLGDAALTEAVLPLLPEAIRDGVRRGPHVFDRDPMTALAVAGFLHVHDQLNWGPGSGLIKVRSRRGGVPR